MAAQTSYDDIAAFVWLALIMLVSLTVLVRLGRNRACWLYLAGAVVAFSAQLGGAG